MDCGKILKSINNGDIIIQLYNPASDLDEVLSVHREAYMKYANTFILFDLNKPENENALREYEQMVFVLLKAGISLVARHRTSNKIIGYCINMIHSRQEPGKPNFYEAFRNKAHFPLIRQLLNFRIDKDKQIDLFNMYGIDHYFEMVYTATLPEFRMHKIATDLMVCAIQLAKELAAGKYPSIIDPSLIGKRPRIVFGSGSSKYAIKIVDKLGFTPVKIFPLNQLKANGVLVSQKIPSEHTKSTLQVLKL
ncbi:uncharacterized protein DMENIID0001_135380 [Sergentomyia squamirostris]